MVILTGSGEFYQLKGVHSYPKPVNGIIPVFNAGGSKEGKAFATRNANYLFTPVIEHEKSRTDIRELKQQAGALGREVGVFRPHLRRLPAHAKGGGRIP